jgi:hypothetical protein
VRINEELLERKSSDSEAHPASYLGFIRDALLGGKPAEA